MSPKYKNKGRMSSAPGWRVVTASSRDRLLSGGPPGQAGRGRPVPSLHSPSMGGGRKVPRAGHTATCETESGSGSCCPLNKTRAYKYEMPQTLAIYGGGGWASPHCWAWSTKQERSGTCPVSGFTSSQRGAAASESVPRVVRAAPASTRGGPSMVNAMKDKLGTKKENTIE